LPGNPRLFINIKSHNQQALIVVVKLFLSLGSQLMCESSLNSIITVSTIPAPRKIVIEKPKFVEYIYTIEYRLGVDKMGIK